MCTQSIYTLEIKKTTTTIVIPYSFATYDSYQQIPLLKIKQNRSPSPSLTLSNLLTLRYLLAISQANAESKRASIIPHRQRGIPMAIPHQMEDCRYASRSGVIRWFSCRKKV